MKINQIIKKKLPINQLNRLDKNIINKSNKISLKHSNILNNFKKNKLYRIEI